MELSWEWTFELYGYLDLWVRYLVSLLVLCTRACASFCILSTSVRSAYLGRRVNNEDYIFSHH